MDSAAMGRMAEMSFKVGDAQAAAPALAALLDDHIRVLGSDHPDTLIVRQSLACWRGDAGGTASAAET